MYKANQFTGFRAEALKFFFGEQVEGFEIAKLTERSGAAETVKPNK